MTLDIKYTKAQKEVFFNTKERFCVVAKGRRFGFTRGCANFCVEALLDSSFKIKKILWVDTINRNLQNYFDLYFMPVLKQLPPEIWEYHKQEKKLNIAGNFLHMVGADNPQNIEGLGYDLIILNEAGIILKNGYLWDNAISPMLLDNPRSRAIIGGVPKGKNRFYDLALNAIKKKNAEWKFFQFSSFDNPLVNADEIKRLIDELGGENSEIVKQEIYGEFVDNTSNLLLSVSEIEKAMQNRDYEPGIEIWSVDVARYGDDKSVIAKLNGNHIYELQGFSNLNTNELSNKIFEHFARAENKPIRIFIDTTGVGAGVFDNLYARNLPVSEAIMSAKAVDNRYKNKRAEMYFTLSQKLKFLRLPNEKRLLNEAMAISYFVNNDGKFQIESKDEIKKIIGVSSDYLDAVAMLFYEPVYENKSSDWSGGGW